MLRQDTSMAHDVASELLEQPSLQWLARAVTIHLCSGTMLNPEICLLNLIRQEKATDADCSGSLAMAVLSAIHQRVVVFVQDVLLGIMPLFFHKELGPNCHLCHVIGTHQFRLHAASGVQLLFP